MAPDRPRRPDPVQDKAAQIARFLRRPIVIIGMMGVGKSTLGPRLGALLKVPFVDTDREIAHAAGCTVAEVFARDGEAKFREVERAVIRRLLRGGLFGQSVTVWVRAERDDIVARLAQDTTRPLLQTGEPVGDIVDRILAEREPVYGRADVAVTWRGPSPARMVRDMIAALHRFIQR